MATTRIVRVADPRGRGEIEIAVEVEALGGVEKAEGGDFDVGGAGVEEARSVWGSIWPLATIAFFFVLFISPILSLDGGWWTNQSRWGPPQRALSVIESWRAGNWSGRWSPCFDYGYGYPFHSFYAPLLSWSSAAGILATGDISAGTRGAVFAALALGVLGLFAAGERLWRFVGGRRAGTTRPGFIAAAAWLMSPFLYADLFVFGRCSEFVAMQALPWIMWSAAGVLSREGAPSARDIGETLLLAFSLACAILAHNFIALVACAVAAVLGPVFVGLRLLPGAEHDGFRSRFSGTTARATLWALGAGAGLAMTAFFWRPALAEMGWTRASALAEGLYRFDRSFLSASDYLDFRRWDYGSHSPTNIAGLPLHLGWIGWAASAGAVAALLHTLTREGRRNWRLAAGIAALMALAGAGVFMTTRESRAIWERHELLRMAQFPYRALAVPAFALAMLAPAGAIAAGRRLRMAPAFALAAALFAASFLDYGHIQGIVANTKENDVAAWGHLRITTADIDEFSTIWTPEGRGNIWPAGRALADPAIRILEESSGGIWAKAKVENLSEGGRAVVVALNYFPGWKARAIGGGGAEGAREEIELKTAPDERTGFVSVLGVPPGGWEIEVWMGMTPLRARMVGVSCGAWAVWFGVWVGLIARWRRSERGREDTSVGRLRDG